MRPRALDLFCGAELEPAGEPTAKGRPGLEIRVAPYPAETA